MLAFISYPHEFKDVAEALNAELRSRKINTFYDRREIKPGDNWQEQIEIHVKQAHVFIVLYSPEAAITSHYFLIETELIQAECEQTLKRVNPVIFNPTKPAKVPEFFRKSQIIQSETSGKSRDERDSYWIAQITRELERLKAFWKKLKQRQIIARSTLTLGAIIIALLSIKLFDTKKELEQAGGSHASDEQYGGKHALNAGERLCHSLLGKYTLHQNYIFVETNEKDARSTATHATWNAIECVPNKRNGDFILKGEDETDFDIEAIIEGRYEQIATVKYTYGSEVHIRKDGILVGRSFDTTIDAKSITPFNKNALGNSFNKPESFINDKIKEMVKLRNDKHRKIKTSPCIPILGETGGKSAIAFVCPGYTRTMVKDRELQAQPLTRTFPSTG
jgi:hypothetical protein